MSRAPHRGMGYRIRHRIERRLILILAVFGMGAGWTFAYHGSIFLWLMEPAGGRLSPFGGLPIVTSPIDAMMATFQLSVRGGVVVALPVAVGSLLTLFSPILPRRVFWFLLVFIPILYACGIAGVAFAYYVMIPTGVGFLLSFGEGFTVSVIHLDEYIGLVTALMFAMVAVFELPPAMYMLTSFGVISYDRFRGYRWHFYIAAPILAGIITPTFDGVNFLIIVVPLLLMWEVGLFASWLARPSEGNYLWLRSIARGVRRLRDAVAWPYRKARHVGKFLYGEFF